MGGASFLGRRTGVGSDNQRALFVAPADDFEEQFGAGPVEREVALVNDDLNPTHSLQKLAEILNHDAGITSAIIATGNRLLHHAETAVIEGKSFLMKDQIDPRPTFPTNSPSYWSTTICFHTG